MCSGAVTRGRETTAKGNALTWGAHTSPRASVKPGRRRGQSTKAETCRKRDSGWPPNLRQPGMASTICPAMAAEAGYFYEHV